MPAWTMNGLPAEAVRSMFRSPVLRAVRTFLARRFARAERRTFRHVPA
ncbi:hypothetical protein AB0K40_43385 [Nonomuraea bangladeshensis]|uniref:Uncharacterized protein n=1 Tax=Nonomuraea bangladeshensis TaxID=404385 RepID=A0ABV3HJA9_9ACTN